MADSVLYVQNGKLKVTVASGEGKEAVVAIHREGEFFGVFCLTGQPRRLATVTAITECVIMRLDKAAISRAIHDQPAFVDRLLTYLLARIARLEEDLADQVVNSSERRLARALLLIANLGVEETPEPVIEKISDETLAEVVGTTRSRICRFMNKFRRLGMIEYNEHELKLHKSLLNVAKPIGTSADIS